MDITHEVEAQDIREAAFIVHDYWSYFPAGTIHVVVVDPTVGSSRRPIVVSCDGHFFVGPDNGVFSFVAGRASEVRAIENRDFMREEISPTFHGRDIFSPAAARLSRGIELSLLGTKITDPVMLRGHLPRHYGQYDDRRYCPVRSFWERNNEHKPRAVRILCSGKALRESG